MVYCNCDDPFESNFFKYFAANFNKLGVKELITTSYDGSLILNTTPHVTWRPLPKGYDGPTFNSAVKKSPPEAGKGPMAHRSLMKSASLSTVVPMRRSVHAPRALEGVNRYAPATLLSLSAVMQHPVTSGFDGLSRLAADPTVMSDPIHVVEKGIPVIRARRFPHTVANPDVANPSQIARDYPSIPRPLSNCAQFEEQGDIVQSDRVHERDRTGKIVACVCLE